MELLYVGNWDAYAILKGWFTLGCTIAATHWNQNHYQLPMYVTMLLIHFTKLMRESTKCWPSSWAWPTCYGLTTISPAAPSSHYTTQCTFHIIGKCDHLDLHFHILIIFNVEPRSCTSWPISRSSPKCYWTPRGSAGMASTSTTFSVICGCSAWTKMGLWCRANASISTCSQWAAKKSCQWSATA